MLAEAFFLKCQVPRMVKDPQPVMLRGYIPAVQGTCMVCGTKVCRIGKPDQVSRPMNLWWA